MTVKANYLGFRNTSHGSVSDESLIKVCPVLGYHFQSALQRMARGTLVRLAAAAAIAIVLRRADAKITVEDSFYRYES